MTRDLNPLWAWCRSQKGKPYLQGAARFGPRGYDCSGFVTVAYRDALGITAPATNTADMARWAEKHPSTLRTPRPPYDPGDLLILGGINGYGDAGHVVIVSDNPTWTWESSGGRGVSQQSTTRLRWSHRIRLPELDTQKGPLMALTDSEQAALLAWVRWLVLTLQGDVHANQVPNFLHDIHDVTLPQIVARLEAIESRLGAP